MLAAGNDDDDLYMYIFIFIYIYIYIYIYNEVHTISFQTFFICAFKIVVDS